MQGRIACCNVLSDLYSMGIEDIDQILMVLGVSLKMNELQREVVTSLLIEGFDDCAKQAQTEVVGGQTVYNPWPMIGGAGISAVGSQEFIMPTGAQVGDAIVMTKALGTQIAGNVQQWRSKEDQVKWNQVKHLATTDEVDNFYRKAEIGMATLNLLGARLMKKYNAHAATDITGFGVQGHANFLAQVQKNQVDLMIHTMPVYKDALKFEKIVRNFKLLEGLSAETSGGLLICLPKENAQNFVDDMQSEGQNATIVGNVVEGSNKAFIDENPKVVEI